MDEPQVSGSRSQTMLAASILAAALIVGGALVYSSGTGGRSGVAQVANPPPSVTSDEGESAPVVSTDDDVVLGERSAPVTLISFGDYQCPFCAKMFQEVEGRLRDEYVKTGKLKMVYRDFPLDTIHPYARGAAEAAQCAKDQGAYWLYHDALFSRQAQIPTMDFVVLASELGLNDREFRACAESGKYRDEVQKDFDDGVAAGVRGTPGNFVNVSVDGKVVTTPLHGALPYESFKRAIDEALARVGS